MRNLLSHFIKHKKIYLTLLYVLLSLIAFGLIITPITLFAIYFHEYSFSNKAIDWANFGSFFGGTYSALFSLISTVILCFTLYLTRKHNENQLAILKHEQTKNEIDYLVQTLEQRLDRKKVLFLGSEQTEAEIIQTMKLSLDNATRIKYGSLCSMTEFINEAIEIAKDQHDLYRNEMPLLNELVSIIARQGDSNFRGLYKALSFERLDSERSFWLLAYAQNDSFLIRRYCERDITLFSPPSSYNFL